MNKIIIKDKTIEIVILNKINKMENSELLELFCLINAFKILETKTGNEYDKAYIKIKYLESMMITEYINIFNLVRIPTFYEFIKYFFTLEKRMSEQNTDTKAKINDYLYKTENISQKIVIFMIFEIKIDIISINKKASSLMKMIQINEMDKEIFKILEKEMWN